MAKGAFAKENITEQILKTFEGSFLNGKEIRIPFIEEGNLVQIKVALTCAKDNIPNPNEGVEGAPPPEESVDKYKITKEEKEEVIDLMKAFNL